MRKGTQLADPADDVPFVIDGERKFGGLLVEESAGDPHIPGGIDGEHGAERNTERDER